MPTGRRRAMLTLASLPLALAACASWERPGTPPRVRDTDLARCRADAYARAPERNEPYVADPGGWVPPREDCRGRGDGRRCTRTGAYYREPLWSTRDANASARNAMENSCMRGRGYSLEFR